MKDLHNQMKANAKAFNRHLTDGYLEILTIYDLLAFCHPIERADFIRKLGEEGFLYE